MEESDGIDAVAPRYTVAVRTLCEFTARRGDLSIRFTPAPSAQQGIAGHAIARRSNASAVSVTPLRARISSIVARCA